MSLLAQGNVFRALASDSLLVELAWSYLLVEVLLLDKLSCCSGVGRVDPVDSAIAFGPWMKWRSLAKDEVASVGV
jgi:hypothetical protein